MTHGVLLLDGGLGQELIRRSPSHAHHHWSLQVMLEAPDLGLAEDLPLASSLHGQSYASIKLQIFHRY